MPQENSHPSSIRSEYEAHGADAYYRQFGDEYRNPHEAVVRKLLKIAVTRWKLDLSNVLDLAAGSGEATLALRDLGAMVSGIDPYTSDAFAARTGQVAERFTFADVAAGALVGRRYTLIVCSFGLHLCEPSRLPGMAQQLALVGERLLIVTPHKRPVIRVAWGWALEGEQVLERVRTRCYLAERR